MALLIPFARGFFSKRTCQWHLTTGALLCVFGVYFAQISECGISEKPGNWGGPP